MNGYNEMVNLNKPFALGEVGPGTTNGQFDYIKW
jgi:mannan endo-1,4-beta-mannosidase